MAGKTDAYGDVVHAAKKLIADEDFWSNEMPLVSTPRNPCTQATATA